MRLLGVFFTFFFGRQPLEKGVWRFQVALGSFFIFSWWQPLEKGIRRFEIALGLLYIFFWWQPLEKGVYFFLVAPQSQISRLPFPRGATKKQNILPFPRVATKKKYKNNPKAISNLQTPFSKGCHQKNKKKS